MARLTLREKLRKMGLDDRTIDVSLMTGLVRVNDEVVRNGGHPVSAKDRISVQEPEYKINRAYTKLKKAVERLKPDITGRICVDLGASHGGFTQVLLEEGAARVYAVDVAYGILDYSVRRDPRVVPVERVNARDIQTGWFVDDDASPGSSLFYTCDLSFISLKTVLKALSQFCENSGTELEGLFLLKPQFEASSRTDRGVIRDPAVREEIVEEMKNWLLSENFRLINVVESELPGTKGNIEYFLHIFLH
jgi:23S rRNA (cytidine1920-2'-O)/16S rRNA (cytidine1409-2'-O)-methyltransferase